MRYSYSAGVGVADGTVIWVVGAGEGAARDAGVGVNGCCVGTGHVVAWPIPVAPDMLSAVAASYHRAYRRSSR